MYILLQGSPPLSRNAPPIAGVVSWARQLLRRVEEPMEVFRRDSGILQSVVSVLYSSEALKSRCVYPYLVWPEWI